MVNETYKTPRKDRECTGEVVDRKSRFIAQIAHVESEDEANAFIAAVSQRHYDARHNVPAWILADGTKRCSDDGEPQRTAGLPILQVLEGAGMKNVCCVVTRYFGGTLLGPGGLIRAYTQATQNALAQGDSDRSIATMTSVVQVDVDMEYSLYDQILHMANGAGAHVLDTIYTDRVLLKLVFLEGEQKDFIAKTKEISAGKDLCFVHEPRFAEF